MWLVFLLPVTAIYPILQYTQYISNSYSALSVRYGTNTSLALGREITIIYSVTMAP